MKTASVRVDMTLEQAEIVRDCLNLFARLSTGQMNILGELFTDGKIPAYRENGREGLSLEEISSIINKINDIKEICGFPINGNLGIGHPLVSHAGKSAWEMTKVLDKAIFDYRQESESSDYSSIQVSYDALLVRYTQQEVPVVRIVSNDPE